MIPQDPVILLSFVNMKLRDTYSNFDAMVEGLDISSQEADSIIEKLRQIGYEYDAARNQFV